ncbi:MAG TPA: sigma-70 family RNA polymerase sigma factor [Nannocystaceae bacterium]|nr:sigma-70 family RNA polymerase sigma factor [Nannocystaceae bacterium]
MSASDAELLASWQDGDRKAGGELIDRYFESVRRFFLNKVGDGADDLIQQTFLSCVQQRDQIRTPEAFRGYLFAAARSKLIDWLRTKGTNPRIDVEVDSVVSAGMSPSSELAARDDERLLVVALRHLPVELQIALELYYFERVRGRELEIALGLPSGTVRSRLRRGLDMLRKKVDELAAASPELRRLTDTSLQRWTSGLADEA